MRQNGVYEKDKLEILKLYVYNIKCKRDIKKYSNRVEVILCGI